jgi:hypothetical protein
MRVYLFTFSLIFFSALSWAAVDKQQASSDWIAQYRRSRTCSLALDKPPEKLKKNDIPAKFRTPLFKAYRTYLERARQSARQNLKIFGHKSQLREIIAFKGENFPVLAVLGSGMNGVVYAVQTQDGVRAIEDYFEEDWAEVYEIEGRKEDLLVYGRDRNLLMTDFVMALPEKVVASESKLEELGIDYKIALDIALWAETQFTDTDVHDRHDILLELTTGRIIQLYPYKRR